MSLPTDPLRDKYAGLALAGMLARADQPDKVAGAAEAFAWGNAMIVEWNKLQPVSVPPSVSNPVAQLSPPATPPFVNNGNQQQEP